MFTTPETPVYTPLQTMSDGDRKKLIKNFPQMAVVELTSDCGAPEICYFGPLESCEAYVQEWGDVDGMTVRVVPIVSTLAGQPLVIERDLELEAKEAIAEALSMITGEDECHPEACYRPEHVLFENYVDDPETLGHVYVVNIHHQSHGQIWLDDRKGDLRLQLADAMERRATLLRKHARILRKDCVANPELGREVDHA